MKDIKNSDAVAAVDALIDDRPGFDAMTPADHSSAVRINDFIYMSPGTSNSYLVKTDAGRVIINTGMGFESLVHKRCYEQVCAGPTPYIVLTQGHVDHVGGVSHLRDETSQLIAHASNAACQHDDERISTVRMQQSYTWFKKTIDAAMKIASTNPELLVQDKPVPDILFERDYAFTVGGVDFEVISTPGGETVDSCVVWLPQHRILFSGNVFGPLFPHFPNINTIRGDRYRFVEPYLAAVNTVRALKPELLITGHFDPIAGADVIDAALARLHDAVDFVHTETLTGMNEGRSIFDLMREVQLPPQLRVGQGYGKVSWAVRTIWESYMGWFKARSSTELYPTQVDSVYGDIIDLAGADAVCQRGQQKLDDAEPEAALHLAEIVLTADAEHRQALALALAAQKMLLQRSRESNFWEAGWLRTRIAELEQKLNSAGASS